MGVSAVLTAGVSYPAVDTGVELAWVQPMPPALLWRRRPCAPGAAVAPPGLPAQIHAYALCLAGPTAGALWISCTVIGSGVQGG